MAQKKTIDTSTAITVSVIDFSAFLEQLDADVAVIKLDWK